MLTSAWVKSSHSFSNSNCVEARWLKSSHSTNNGACVEVADIGGQVQVRDSKDPGGPVLAFPSAQWEAFIAALKDGGFA